MTLTFDLLTLKMVSESHVTWATSVPILIFLGISVLDLGPMYATDRLTSDVGQKHRLMPPPIRGGGVIILATPMVHCVCSISKAQNVQCGVLVKLAPISDTVVGLIG